MTARQKVGWKVLYGTPRDSCFISSSYKRKYNKGRKTTPAEKSGPLCVFNKKYSAERFLVNFVYDAHIVKCLYVPSKETMVWEGRRRIRHKSLNSLPPGTALADSVTCLE